MNEFINVHKIFAGYFQGCETLAYALSSKLGEGNICLDTEEYKKALPLLLEEQKTKESFNVEDSKFWAGPEDFAQQCEPGDFVTHQNDELKPFVIQKGYAYLQRYFTYETQIIHNIRRLGANLHIITGGPGTGKTYSVSTKLAELFGNNLNLKVALAAPTGKAGARMNQAISDFAVNPENGLSEDVRARLTGLKAKTLHSMLGYISDSVFFRY
ncbi:MAG: AAA family ATPase, partial [Bacteroidota bacterium]